ncbi:MAG: electron transport complex subunit RsxB [Pseudomonadota bacterium]
MLEAVILLTTIAAFFGLILTLAARSLPGDQDTVTDKINDLLPQTQCAQCGFPGCRPYAAAIAAGEAPINRCPPGGDATIVALARLLNRDVLPLDATLPKQQAPALAVIDEAACIGCARCLPACPVDAIIGAHQFTHTVVADLCTGCELCIAPCPVDCIAMVTVETDAQ